MTSATDLFRLCSDAINAAGRGAAAQRMMHEALVMACNTAMQEDTGVFGNLFAKTDYLCRKHGVSRQDTFAIQAMRRHSNSTEPLPAAEAMYDIRALCLFVSAVFGVSVPPELTARIPRTNRMEAERGRINRRYVRCVVHSWQEGTISVTADTPAGAELFQVDCTPDGRGTDNSYIIPMLRSGMQLNLIDCRQEDRVLRPEIIVVEPDFMADISQVARCFTQYGRSHIAYTINRLQPRANSSAILLGNFAGDALDSAIHSPQTPVNSIITDAFRRQALQYCTCADFSPAAFVADAHRQAANMAGLAERLLSAHPGAAAVLEPSFVCEQLGLRGRADLITTDKRLLVEQKSGKNRWLEGQQMYDAASLPATEAHLYQEDHFVQLLLYYGVLRRNFGIQPDGIDMRLLYSRYPAGRGLLRVSFYRALFLEAIKLRNRIVWQEYEIARRGFQCIMPHLNADTLNGGGGPNRFFDRYIRPRIDAVCSPIAALEPLERDYFCTMMTFVYREQLQQKAGGENGHSASAADLWNMPIAEKKDTGNIIIGGMTRATAYEVTIACTDSTGAAPHNFRRGDMVYVYPAAGSPDVRQAILFKGTVSQICRDGIEICLTDQQTDPDVFGSGMFAVEHAPADTGTDGCMRSLMELASAPARRRRILLGTEAPRRNPDARLAGSYSQAYNHIILAQKQAADYYLLVGPPGTGKTSMAMRFMVEEELADPCGTVLLMSYTNRAVDEICAMLADAGTDFIRIAGENAADPRFHDNLIGSIANTHPKLTGFRSRIAGARVIVATTSAMLAQPFVFDIKEFSLAIVDEASQILEPNIVGLLAAHRGGQCRIGRFVLVGDYKQLPAVVQSAPAHTAVSHPQLVELCLTDCRNSLFERLIRLERKRAAGGDSPLVGTLRRQGRMHPAVAEFPCRMFYAAERLQPVPLPHQQEAGPVYAMPAADAIDSLLKRRRMIFLPSEPCRSAELSGKVNPAEARMVATLLLRIRRFYGDGFSAAHSVGVIVPYRNQIAMIRQETERMAAGTPWAAELQDVSIDTVERYQGSQRDVIIYSFTIQSRHQLEFLTSNCFVEDGRVIDRKLNVALTRARRQMIMTGNVTTLAANPIFAELIRLYTPQEEVVQQTVIHIQH